MALVILTVVGPDRPGLISRISEQVASHGGSWMESRLSHLAGRFAGIALASLPDTAVEDLRAAVAGLAGEGLDVVLHRAEAAPSAGRESALALSIVCQDRPGILRDVTRALAAAHVNIEELTTNVLSGSFSGEPMFRAEARLRLPAGVGIDDVRRDLEQLGNDMMVDIQHDEPAPAS